MRDPQVLHGEFERLLAHPHSQRFVNDFLGQWLKLREIEATDPDKKLYPEFSPYLQDSMVAETRAYFRELLDKDLESAQLVKSPFVMVNQKLATHYGILDVSGTQVRGVPLPDNCPRGGFLTQAAILKITANGTTTSPVPRGAFVIDRMLGQPPEPPPANVAAIEPDVRGATTIREQLAKHREHAVCASCHKRIDPLGVVRRDRWLAQSISFDRRRQPGPSRLDRSADRHQLPTRPARRFHDGLAIAWIDPTKTNRAALEESLKKRGVQLKLP